MENKCLFEVIEFFNKVLEFFEYFGVYVVVCYIEVGDLGVVFFF